MSFYQARSLTELSFEAGRHPSIDHTEICPSCLELYQLGIDGTVNGCDRCEGIIRNADGTINMNAYTETFIIESTGEEIGTQCICLEYIGDNGPCPVHGEGLRS
jgi:hypothetical protein